MGRGVRRISIVPRYCDDLACVSVQYRSVRRVQSLQGRQPTFWRRWGEIGGDWRRLERHHRTCLASLAVPATWAVLGCTRRPRNVRGRLQPEPRARPGEQLGHVRSWGRKCERAVARSARRGTSEKNDGSEPPGISQGTHGCSTVPRLLMEKPHTGRRMGACVAPTVIERV